MQVEIGFLAAATSVSVFCFFMSCRYLAADRYQHARALQLGAGAVFLLTGFGWYAAMHALTDISAPAAGLSGALTVALLVLFYTVKKSEVDAWYQPLPKLRPISK